MEGISFRKFSNWNDLQNPFMPPTEETPQQPVPTQQEAAGELGYKLAQDVLAIEGVLAVTLGPYQLTVEKGVGFEWEDLSPAIREILLPIFPQKEVADKVQVSVRPLESWEDTPQGKAQLEGIRLQEQHNGFMKRIVEEQEGGPPSDEDESGDR